MSDDVMHVSLPSGWRFHDPSVTKPMNSKEKKEVKGVTSESAKHLYFGFICNDIGTFVASVSRH